MTRASWPSPSPALILSSSPSLPLPVGELEGAAADVFSSGERHSRKLPCSPCSSSGTSSWPFNGWVSFPLSSLSLSLHLSLSLSLSLSL